MVMQPLDEKDKHGRTVAHKAALAGDVEILQKYYDAGLGISFPSFPSLLFLPSFFLSFLHFLVFQMSMLVTTAAGLRCTRRP